MLRLKKLKISNVGRFVGDHDIDLSSKPALIQVDALNKNTGGSSGSGKSTIFNSLEYLLGVNQIPSTVLQSRLTKNSMSVSGEFDFQGKKLEILRSKSDGLTIKIDDLEIVSGNNKAAEEKLDQILGIPRELLRKMIHKRQKEGGFFLGLTPKETHSFLIEALDLRVWSQRLEKAEADVKNLSLEESRISAKLSATAESLATAQNSLNSMEAPTLNFPIEIVNALESGLSKAIDVEKNIISKINFELSKIEPPTPPPSQDRSSLEPLQKELLSIKAQEAVERKMAIENLNIANQKLQQKEQNLLVLKRQIEVGKISSAQLEEIKSKIVLIKQGTCPTCSQSWNTGQSQIDALAADARYKVLDIQKGAQAESQISSAETAISEKKEEILKFKTEASHSKLAEKIKIQESILATEIQRLDKELRLMNQAYQDQIETNRLMEAQVRLKYEPELISARFNIDEHNRLVTQKKTEVDSYKKSLALYEKNTSILRQSIKDLTDSIKLLEQEKTDTQKALEITSDAVGIIKAYTNSLFQDALDSIALKATQILSRIPNMATASIYFEGFKETKSGTIKEEVSAVMTMDGEIGIPIKSMSGGERTAIDLAVDLAVIDMVEEIAGKGLDLFVLDEPFDGLDSTCREQCLEILKMHMTEKKIVIVDHSNETKEMVSDRILVVRDGQESSVRDTFI